MWLYFPVAVARNVFGAADQSMPSYTAGVEWAGICFGMYSAVCFAFSFLLPSLAKLVGRKWTHSICLICGGLGLLSVAVIHRRVSAAVDDGRRNRLGEYAFHAVFGACRFPAAKIDRRLHGNLQLLHRTPEILASLAFGWIMRHLLHNNRMAAVVCGGVFMLMAATLMQRVKDPGERSSPH